MIFSSFFEQIKTEKMIDIKSKVIDTIVIMTYVFNIKLKDLCIITEMIEVFKESLYQDRIVQIVTNLLITNTNIKDKQVVIVGQFFVDFIKSEIVSN